MSCLGLAALGAIREERRTCGREGFWVLPANVGGDAIETYKDGSLATNKLVPEGAENVPSNSSLMPANLNSLTKCREERNSTGKATLECVHAAREDDEGNGGQGRVFEAGSSFETIVPFVVSHVASFAAERLVPVAGASLATADIRSAYEAWCAANGHHPISRQKLSTELLRLGCCKWKSCGLIRYRDLQLRAS